MDEKELTSKAGIYQVKHCRHCDEVVTSVRIWKLTNQMRMNLVAGVECLVQEPRRENHGDDDS